MLLNDVERLISEEKIVACKISDLYITRLIKYSDKRYELWNDCRVTDLGKDVITLLYKIDDEHYMEYFSERVVRVKTSNFWGFMRDENEAYKEIGEIYENNPFMVYAGDLVEISPDIKKAFSKYYLDKKRIATSLNASLEIAKSLIQTRKNESCLERKSIMEGSTLFKDLEDKEVFVASINDLKDVILKVNNENFNYNFATRNRNIINDIPNSLYIVLTKISPTLYEEYYSKAKILVGDNSKVKTILKPQNFNEFINSYNFLLEYPLAITGELKKFDNSCKHLLVPNLGKEEEIKEIIEQMQKDATTSLANEYAKTKQRDEEEAYTYDALVELALRLKNENKEN